MTSRINGWGEGREKGKEPLTGKSVLSICRTEFNSKRFYRAGERRGLSTNGEEEKLGESNLPLDESKTPESGRRKRAVAGALRGRKALVEN